MGGKKRMAVYSMTGYANASTSGRAPGAAALHEPGESSAAEAVAAGDAPAATALQVGVEMRSVNNRFLDLALRLPDEYRSLEPALRELVTARFKRGKVEIRVSVEENAAKALAPPRREQLEQLAAAERLVRALLPDARPLSTGEVLQWCKASGQLAVGGAPDGDAAVLEAALRCADALAAARAREGARLAELLSERVTLLRSLSRAAEPLVPAAVHKLQQRFLDRWRDALDKTGAEASLSRQAIEERALSEAAAYAIRIDVAEELGRLRSHLDEIDRLLAKGGEVGKRLEFLIQELLREANTLGSKSPSMEMTAIAVDMKVAIEQLREQVQNVE